MRLELPPGLKIRVPVGVTLTRDYIDYRSKYTRQDNVSAVGPKTDARERLAKLVPAAKIDTLIAMQQSGLHEYRTFLVGRHLKKEATAEFFVLVDSTAKVAEVKFIKVDEALRPFVEPLRAIPYPADWPDAAPVKLVRRGIVSCTASTGECRFVLYMPGDVTSVD